MLTSIPKLMMLAVMLLCVTGIAEPQSLVAPGATPMKVAEGLKFGEGPAVDSAGNLFFSDIPNARIMKLDTEGMVSVARANSGNANGLMFDKDGNLYACEMAGRRVSKMTPEGQVTTVASRCEGKRFNQPNDLWLDAHGGIFFTDPIYGAVDGQDVETHDVYYIEADGEVSRAATGLVNPNGIVGTPDGKKLYVADHGGKATYVFDIGPGGALSNRTKLIDRGSDGMVLDEQGNLYLTGEENVEVFSPAGKKLETIPMPERTTNVTFGGKRLYVTCPKAVYAVGMNVAGAPAPER